MNQGIWLAIYRHWMWIGAPLALASAFALWILITGVISQTKRSRLFNVPLVPRQEIGFDEAGLVALAM